jgi:hypothetical protein
MKMVLLLCAKETVIDRATNAASVFGLHDDINVPASFPILLAPFCVMSVLERSSQESEKQVFTLQIKLGKQQILSQRIDVDFQGKTRVRTIVQLSGLPLTGPGLLDVSALKGNRLLGKYWFNVAQTGPIEATNSTMQTGAIVIPNGHQPKTSQTQKKNKKR